MSSGALPLPGVHIRDAIRDDLPLIVDIYNSTVPTRMVTADTVPVTIESRVRWFEDHSPRRRPLWVAEADGTVVGWLSYSNFYGRPAYDRTCEVSIYLRADFRQRGLGRQLLQRCIDDAPRYNVATLIGIIFAHNAPSLRLFERLGFTRWGHLPRVAVLDSVERDVVIVGKRVAE